MRSMTDAPFPHIVTSDGGSLAEYLAGQKALTEKQLASAGVLLFRGFAVPDAQHFDAAVAAHGGAAFTYEKSLSNAVRVNVTKRVFTANEAPPDTEIFLHHEMAQTPIYPSRLFFYCEIKPGSGGATPVCRSDWLLARMEAEAPSLVQRFEEKGVRYASAMPGEDDAQSGQGRSWRSTLGVDSRDAAEARLSKLAYDWQWGDDGTLHVRTPVLPAIRDLGDGTRSFFNQLIAAWRGWQDAERAVSYGDGAPIDRADMELIIAIADDIVADLEWQAGDVALVDNYRAMHGRRPFSGKRRVLAALVA